MNSGTNWGLVEDKIALKDGKELPLVSRRERRMRALSLITNILEIAETLGITQVDLAKRLSINRRQLHRWHRGKALPTTAHYKGLLQLHDHLVSLLRESGGAFRVPF